MFSTVSFDLTGRVISNTLKVVVMAALLGAQGWVVNITTDWLAGVRINVPVVLVTYSGNAVI